MQALLDTGSPVSIVSIDFLLKVPLTTTATDQIEESPKGAARERIKFPTTSVRNFGGGDVYIIGQVTVSVPRGEHCYQTVMLVQKGIQLEVLLRTDLFTKFGFSLMQKEYNDDATDLLTGWSCKSGEESNLRAGQNKQHSTLSESSVRVIVYLLKAVRVPGCHGRTVKVQGDNVDGLKGKPCCLVPSKTRNIGQVWLPQMLSKRTSDPYCGESQFTSSRAVSRGSDRRDRRSGDYATWYVSCILQIGNYLIYSLLWNHIYREHTGSCPTEQAKKMFSALEIESGLKEGQD